MPRRLPKRCLHKLTEQAYVRVDGRMKYPGKCSSPETEVAFDGAMRRSAGVATYAI